MDSLILPIGKTEVNVFYELHLLPKPHCIQITGAKHNGKAIDLSQKWIDHAQEVALYVEGIAEIPSPLH